MEHVQCILPQVSFEDLLTLFEIERETIKRQRLESQRATVSSPVTPEVTRHDTSGQDYESELYTTPRTKTLASSPLARSEEENSDVFQTPAVVLRRKKPRRVRPGPSSDEGLSAFSPILAEGNVSRSPPDPGECVLTLTICQN